MKLTHMTTEEGNAAVDELHRSIAEVEKKRQIKGLFRLLRKTLPGTDVEITVDVPLARKETIFFKRELSA